MANNRTFKTVFKDGSIQFGHHLNANIKYGWRVIHLDGEVIAKGFSSSKNSIPTSARNRFNQAVDDIKIPHVSKAAPMSAWAKHELSLLLSSYNVSTVKELKKVISNYRREKWLDCKLEIEVALRVD